VISSGLGPMMALSTDLAIGAAPADRAGAAAAMASAAPQLGGALGVAVLGSVITAVYRSHTPATHTLTVGADQASRDAYLAGIHVAALASAVLMASAATAVIRTGRKRRKAESERQTTKTGPRSVV
jgi:DHA2 family multidrug resistance protein-like MFS transporter